MIPIYESYAQALYTASKNLSSTELIASELSAAKGILSQCSSYLNNPVVCINTKVAALNDVLSGAFNPLTKEFVLLMAERQHLKHYDQATDMFLQLSGCGKTKVRIYVPYALDYDVMQMLKTHLYEISLIPSNTREPEFNVTEDKELIGGYMAYCNGFRIDASLKAALEKLRRSG